MGFLNNAIHLLTVSICFCVICCPKYSIAGAKTVDLEGPNVYQGRPKFGIINQIVLIGRGGKLDESGGQTPLYRQPCHETKSV